VTKKPGFSTSFFFIFQLCAEQLDLMFIDTWNFRRAESKPREFAT
jgi:hypothetical protein